MEIFNLTLRQMLLMFTLMLAGYFLRKKRLLPENADIAMSKMETYVFVPALTLHTQMTKCTVQTFRESWTLILYGVALVICGIALAYVLAPILIRNDSNAQTDYKRNIYRYALTFGNYGFMGNFIVLGVFGADVFYRYSLLTLGVGLFCSSWGVYELIPKEKGAGILENLKRGLVTPMMISLLVGMVLGLTGVAPHIPGFLVGTLDSASACQGPVAMLLAGFVIGGYDIKELLSDARVYIATALRLIAIPAVMVLVLRLIGTGKDIITLALIAFATPLGLNTIVYPAAYGGETKTGASMAMISHTLSVITIPIMYLIFVEML